MFGIENLTGFLLASAAVIVVPGPATLFVSAHAQLGARHARQGALGIVLGDVVLMCASGLGLSSVITRWPVALEAIRVLGALYIGVLGASAILASRRLQRGKSLGGARPAAATKEGLLLTLANPKPILFFAAFFPLFISSQTGSWPVSFVWLGIFYEALNIAYYAVLILAILRLKNIMAFQQAKPRHRQLASGIALLVCAVLVLFASHPATAP